MLLADNTIYAFTVESFSSWNRCHYKAIVIEGVYFGAKMDITEWESEMAVTG